LLDFSSFVRSFAFAVIYAGIEYRYVNRREEKWTGEVQGFFEKPAVWVISPYQLYLLLPLFVVAGFATSLTSWIGNVFLIAIVEDAAYFAWRGRMVMPGEWTTTLFGSYKVGRFAIPVWWAQDLLIVAVAYALPF
jgi:hypothetical protein